MTVNEVGEPARMNGAFAACQGFPLLDRAPLRSHGEEDS
jgi:hypothetical protein